MSSLRGASPRTILIASWRKSGARRRRRQARQEAELARREAETGWDNSLIVSPQVRPDVVNFPPDPSEPYRERITRFRTKAAGTALHPLCQSKQVNDKVEMLEGKQPHDRFGSDLSMAPPRTKRQQREARHIRGLLKIKEKRQERLDKLVTEHKRMEADDRIVAQMTRTKYI